jgi:glycosyltransferase involved in cell wall biosynthesis
VFPLRRDARRPRHAGISGGDGVKLVISAVNLTEGGPLTVLREVVQAAVSFFPDWQVHVLVHERGLLRAPGAIEIPFPRSKRSWLYRLYLEWFVFGRVAAALQPDVWLSMHDITPRVGSTRQYVYCHNPSPFCDVPIEGERFDRTFRLFRRYYGYLYGIFIKRNAAVIVQQDWLRDEFVRRYGVGRVIVAYPQTSAVHSTRLVRRPIRFIYPALARPHKNFEVLGDCAERLERDPRWKGEFLVTIDGTENAYAADILARFRSSRSLRFIGRQSPEQLDALYAECDALVFPSKLETWGLPLTEAKTRGLPILAADLHYAHETVGTCSSVRFFDPSDASALAALVLALHLGETEFAAVERAAPAQPFANGWSELLSLLLVDEAAAPAPAP